MKLLLLPSPRRFVFVLSLVCASPLDAQTPVELSPNAPIDRPLSVVHLCQWRAALEAMEPYVAEARASYPAARRRFLAGLPPRHTMFVTTRLQDNRGRQEQVFVAVDSIVGDLIVGRIWSDITVVAGYRGGQRHAVSESTIVDWMIARPDGSEEGNIVGKFLDTYTPPASCHEADAPPDGRSELPTPLLDNVAAVHPEHRTPAHSLRVQLRGADLGSDVNVWRAWIRSL